MSNTTWLPANLRDECAPFERALLRGESPPIGGRPELIRELLILADVYDRLGDYEADFPDEVREITGTPRIAAEDFEIIEPLGRGGQGTVFKARCPRLGRVVAIKRVTKVGDEAKALARLQHPNIVQVFEVRGNLLVLEYVEGGKLSGARTPKEAAKLIETLARAMHHAHSLGVVHRDLKPSNILIAKDGTPKIADFGIAKLDDGKDSSVGTRQYMAPEQTGGVVTPATDVYAFGVILSELVKAPCDLQAICDKCLRAQPSERYSTAEELANDLARFQRGEAVYARPLSVVIRSARWCRRNWREKNRL